jgi:hypothetical protein
VPEVCLKNRSHDLETLLLRKNLLFSQNPRNAPPAAVPNLKRPATALPDPPANGKNQPRTVDRQIFGVIFQCDWPSVFACALGPHPRAIYEILENVRIPAGNRRENRFGRF